MPRLLMNARSTLLPCHVCPSCSHTLDIVRFYGVRVVRRIDAVRERYYAISVERRLKHPGVVAITSAAREELFK